jgi:protein-S-isoprenylcysteine O-methyltransferase Ste14
MSTPGAQDETPSRKAGIPRWAAYALVLPLGFLVAIPLVHGVGPWAISLLGPWYGWADGCPALWNLLGLAPVAVGAAVLLWLMVYSCTQASKVPDRVELDWSPKLLLKEGPYAFSRHPMYLAELALWLGWAILYGSLPVLIGFLAISLLVSVLAPREEKALEAKFGEVYRVYKSKVPRWLGLPRR